MLEKRREVGNQCDSGVVDEVAVDEWRSAVMVCCVRVVERPEDAVWGVFRGWRGRGDQANYDACVNVCVTCNIESI